MRGALELLDFEDASINDMKRMLLQVRADSQAAAAAAAGWGATSVASRSCTIHNI
jgi:hypothetical protein